MTLLAISLGDELHAELSPGERLSFGRRADLIIDESKFLHRVMGEFAHDAERWWLHNRGSRIEIELRGENRSLARIPPLLQAPIQRGTSWVRFRAGSRDYELELHLAEPPEGIEQLPVVADGTSTSLLDGVPINDEQRLLLVALAEHRLRNPAEEMRLPTNAQITARTGLRTGQIQRKLDHLCRRLDKSGQYGLWGGAGNDATDRRRRLVEYVLEAGMIAEGDLDLLD